MVSIRSNNFETNSSSFHTITLCDDNQYHLWSDGDLMYDHRTKSLMSFDEYYENYIAELGKLLATDSDIKINKAQLEEAEVAFNLEKSIALEVWKEHTNAKYNYNEYTNHFSRFSDDFDTSILMSDAEISALLFKKNLFLDGVMSLGCFLDQSDDSFENSQMFKNSLAHIVGYIESF